LKKDNKYLVLLSLLYFAVSFVGILHHEFFIDEAHHWLLSRDSNSVSELIQNTRLEGHPLLWGLLLYGVTRFTSDPFWMQFLHILISTATVIVFLRKAPFNWIFKTLFIFGYFMVFEYNLISRNYGLGILFLFLACTVFKNREQKFSLICLYLALASNTHLLFSVPAFALFLTLIAEQIQGREFFKAKFIAGYSIFALGLVVIYVQIHSTNSGWLLEPINKLPFQERLVDGFVSFFKGVVAIPDFRTIHFWNSNLIVNLSRPIAGVLALLIYLLPLLLFFKNKKTLFFVYTALIGAQIFFFITQRSATRFHGMTYIVIIIALWIEDYYSSGGSKLNSSKLSLFKKPIIYSILLIQFCSGIYAYSMDYFYAFSSAKETIDFTRRSAFKNEEIITVTCDGTLLSAYLEGKIYFLCDQSLQSFCHWDSGCAGNVNQQKSVALLTDYMGSHHKNVLFISYYALTDNLYPDVFVKLNDKIKVRFVKKFDSNIVDKTNYYIFEVSCIK
jgi:hypothetical protein